MGEALPSRYDAADQTREARGARIPQMGESGLPGGRRGGSAGCRGREGGPDEIRGRIPRQLCEEAWSFALSCPVRRHQRVSHDGIGKKEVKGSRYFDET